MKLLNNYQREFFFAAICWTKHEFPLEFVFLEQSYASLHSGRSLAWDHVRGNIDDPRGTIADFCGTIADPCGFLAIGGRCVTC